MEEYQKRVMELCRQLICNAHEIRDLMQQNDKDVWGLGLGEEIMLLTTVCSCEDAQEQYREWDDTYTDVGDKT